MPSWNGHLLWILQGFSPVLPALVNCQLASGACSRPGQQHLPPYRQDQGEHHRSSCRTVVFHPSLPSTVEPFDRSGTDHLHLLLAEVSHCNEKRPCRTGNRTIARVRKTHVVLCVATNFCRTFRMSRRLGLDTSLPGSRKEVLASSKRNPLVKDKGDCIDYKKITVQRLQIRGFSVQGFRLNTPKWWHTRRCSHPFLRAVSGNGLSIWTL